MESLHDATKISQLHADVDAAAMGLVVDSRAASDSHRSKKKSFLVEGELDLLSCLHSHLHHPDSLSARQASAFSDGRRQQHPRGHRAALLSSSGNLFRLPGHIFAADSRRDDRAQLALLSSVSGEARNSFAL